MRKKTDKPWYKSRANWGGLLTALAGVLYAVAGGLDGSMDWGTVLNTCVPLVGTGLAIIGIRARL